MSKIKTQKQQYCSTIQVRTNDAPKNTMMFCYSLIDRQSSIMSTAPIVPKLIIAKVATPKYRLLKIMIDWEYLSLLFVCCFRLCFSFCSISEWLHGFLIGWSCSTAHCNKSSACENCESSVHSIRHKDSA